MTDINSAHIGTSALIEKTQVKLAKEINSSISLENIKSNNDDLKAVANQFEAIFLEMLLKQARESKLSDGLFDTDADDNFVQMFDAELAKSSSELVDIELQRQ